MCGFAGLFTSAGYTSEELAARAERMTTPLAHRGPDAQGVWSDAAAGVAFGFRRLAVLDLTTNGHQPMQSASGRYVVVFNGEVYNFLELRRELESRGGVFRGGSDTEVVLAAFDTWGVHEALSRFVGMFAMAVWDVQQRSLSLCRDRLGEKPLYVYSEPGLVTFGSELKALAAGPSFSRAIDDQALAAYLRFLYVPAPRTIFARAIKVPSAHVLTIRDPRCAIPAAEPYWSLHEIAHRGLADPLPGSEADVVDELDHLLGRTVRARLHADVPIGALLSGGVDSSAIVALMQEAGTSRVKTYTVGFADAGFNEANFAAEVAGHLGTDHTEFYVSGDEARSLVPRLCDVYDEPFANPSQLPALLICQLARRQVTVALSGDGGDELFAGYNRYRYGPRLMASALRMPRRARRCAASLLRRVPPIVWQRAQQWTQGGPGQHHASARLTRLAHVLESDDAAGMYRALMSAAWQDPRILLSTNGTPARPSDGGDDEQGEDDVNTRDMSLTSSSMSMLERMMLADQAAYLSDDSLTKMDRASMAVNLEVRSPLLDHHVVEWSWRLPRALKLRAGAGKWALRQVLYRRVPARLIDRPKMGFTVPIDAWLRGPLRGWAEGLLLDARPQNDLLDRAAVARTWRDFRDGRQSAGLGVWAVAVFEAWRARWAA